MLTSSNGVVNIYKYGASVTAAIKISLASIGLYSSEPTASAIEGYILAVIGAYMPPFLAIDRGFVGWLDAIITVIMIIIIGSLIAGGKREINTPAKYR